MKKKAKAKTKAHYSQSLSIVRKFYPNVTQCVAATEPLEIEILASDRGVQKDHVECAIAVAAKRCTHADAVIVSRRTAYVIKGRTATRFEIPERAAREIVSFDRGGGFAPGTYELIPPYDHRPLDRRSTHGVKSGALIKRRISVPGVRISAQSKDV